MDSSGSKRATTGKGDRRVNLSLPPGTVEKLLTERETEILGLLAQGLTNVEIAKQLYVSSHTVKNHITSIYRKLGIYDRVQAAIIAVQQGLYRPE